MRALLAALIALLPLSLPAAIPDAAHISQVQLHPDSAWVTREAEVELSRGEQTLLIDDLPVAMQPDSLQVRFASSEVTLVAVDLGRRHAREVVNEEEQRLRRQLEELRAQRRETEDRQQAASLQLEYIRAMTQADNEGYRQLPPREWPTAWRTLAEATGDAQAQGREAENRMRELDKTIRQVEAQLKDIQTGAKEYQTARLHLRSESTGNTRLALRYRVNNAGWRPIYSADLDTRNERLRLTARALVHQRSGEDWNKVRLRVSSLRPSAQPGLPPLEPWVIDFRPTPPVLREKAAAPDAELMALVGAPAEAESRVFAEEFGVEYEAAAPVSLPSGADKRRITLQRHQLPAELSVRSVPGLDSRALLFSQSLYDGESPLLPGKLDLFRDGVLVGDTRLALTQKDSELELGFGEDDRVQIEYLPDPEKKSESGFIAKQHVITRHRLIRVHNHHDRAMPVTVYARLPVAADEEIEVEMTSESTPPEVMDVDNKKGVIAWKRTLEAGQNIDIRFGYRVRYPSDREVRGL